MVNEKRKVLPIILFVFSLVAAAALGAVFSFGDAYADDTHTNAILDEKASIAAGAPVAYTVPASWKYGESVTLPDPRLQYDTDAEITVALSLDGNELASDISFDDITYYVNRSMPCGEYVLTLSYGGVDQPDGKAGWWTAEADDDTITTTTHYLANPGIYPFTVTKADFDYELSERVKDAFGGEVRFVYDGQAHFASNGELLAELESELYKDMRGGYWATEAADGYFGGFEVTYNVIGTSAEHYHTEEEFTSGGADGDCADAAPVEAGKYRVYYNVSARNFTDIAADNRESCVFRSVIMREVAVPVFTAEYDGDLKKPEIDGFDYTVVQNDGGTDAGVYDVVLRLRNPELYIWQGQDFDNRTEELTVDFEITKAANGWVTLPTVDRWTEGEYDAVENVVVGAARFGQAHIIITDEDGNVVYNRLAGVNKLDKAKAGTYTLTAYVSESDNWYGISGDNTYTKIIRIYEKPGMAWWGIMLIVLGLAAVIALVFFLLDRLGILRVMSKKHVLKMRLDSDMDATKAALRFASAKQNNGISENSDDAQDEHSAPEADRSETVERHDVETSDVQAPVQEQEQEQPEKPEQTSEPSAELDTAEQEPTEQENIETAELTEQEPETPVEQQSESTPQTSEPAPTATAKSENVQFLTEDMINEYIYGMSSAQASFTDANPDAEGIIVATTFDKAEE